MRLTHHRPDQGPEVFTPLRGQGPAWRRRTRKSSDNRGARHVLVQVGILNSGEVRAAGTRSLDERRSGLPGLGGPTKLLGRPRPVRVSGRSWTRGRTGGSHKSSSGRGPGGVGINQGSSVYSRGGSDPGRQPTRGSVSTSAGLPVPGRLSFLTPRKVRRWVWAGSPEPAPE